MRNQLPPPSSPEGWGFPRAPPRSKNSLHFQQEPAILVAAAVVAAVGAEVAVENVAAVADVAVAVAAVAADACEECTGTFAAAAAVERP